MAEARRSAFSADSSALPQTTSVFVPPSVSVTSFAVVARMVVTWARMSSGSERYTVPIAVNAGGNVKSVQRMLGHASAAMTLDRYADLFDDGLDRLLDQIDGAR